MIDLVPKNDTRPVCPHCKEEITQVWYRQLAGVLGRRYIYFCSRCRASLGVSHRKGFFMG